LSEVNRKLTAILFTDLVGFTEIMRQDERKAMNILFYKRQLLEPIITNHKGKNLKEMGDGYLISFPSAIEAVKCAIEIQNTTIDIPALNLRIGIHIGDVIQENDDIFGDGVNIASRIRPFAEPGQICLSQSVFESIQGQREIQAKSIGKQALKGIDEPHELYTIDLTTSPEGSPPLQEMVYKKTAHKFKIKSFASWATGIILTIFVLFQAVDYLTQEKVITIDNSIAIIPFENIRKVEQYNWLSTQFLSNLTFTLGKSKIFEVIDRYQVIKMLRESKADHAGPPELAQLGKDLNTNFVLFGSFTITGDQIQITTTMIDAETRAVTPVIQELYSIDDPVQMVIDLSNKVFEKLENIIIRKDL